MTEEGYVLLLGPGSPSELLGLDAALAEPLEVYDAAARTRTGQGLELLRAALERGVVRRVVYLGVDGALPRLIGGEQVLDVYGSAPRLRCTRCGRKWWLEEGTVCPGCGAPGQRDYHDAPRSRLLGEAIYELTTASTVAVHGLGEPPLALGAVLALAASRFTRVALLEPVPRQLRGLGLEEPGKNLVELLEELAALQNRRGPS